MAERINLVPGSEDGVRAAAAVVFSRPHGREDCEEEQAHRVAYGALKHSFEKVGDHWEPKDEKGPSDERAARGGPDTRGETAGGVDVRGHTRDELYERAKALGIDGRSSMTKVELGQAIARAQD